MTRRLPTIFSNALLAITIALVAIFPLTFFRIGTTRLNHPAGWQIIARGGVIRIDNEPQVRRRYADALAENDRQHAAWEAAHDQLRFAMEGSPFGPAYTAARLKLDAWEHEHGFQWKPLKPASVPLLEHRMPIVWLIVLATLLALLTRRDKSVPINRARFAFRIAAVAICIAIAVLWAQSYRQLTNFRIYTADSIYTAAVNHGKVSIGFPKSTNPTKLAKARQFAALITNNQVKWTVGPIYSRVQPPRGRRAANGPAISAYIEPGTPAADLEADPDTAEVSLALSEALHNPDRYVAAHVLLTALRETDNDIFMSFMLRTRVTSGNAKYSQSRFNDLNITLTPEQQAVKADTPMPSPNIVPGQMPAIEAKWHKVYDIQTQPISLKYSLSLFLLPACWIFLTIRRRYRLPPNHCRCGYNLTGNISGICPECGIAVKQVILANVRAEPVS